MRSHEPALRLNLGCGDDILQGYVNHDRVRHRPEVDVAHDLSVLPWPWESDRAQVIRLLDANQVPPDFDLLSIDIDGNDYWVWSAIKRWRPRVVVIECNASFAPPQKWVMKEDHGRRWDGISYHGASLASLSRLGEEKGYSLVATNSTGVNAFFVRDDLAADGRFLDPAVYHHYSPPRFGPDRGGHPQGWGPFLEI